MNILNVLPEYLQEIEAVEHTEKLKEIYDKLELGELKETHKYPFLNFRISKEEAKTIKSFTKDDYRFPEDRKVDPLTKILYLLAWKQGDLHKIDRILEGIDNDDERSLPKEAIVFHQLGKFSRDNLSQPIIDQHVLRAYKVLKEKKPTVRNLNY